MPNKTRELVDYSLEHVTIVAAVNYIGGNMMDWAAYIGPTAWGIERIASRGCKLVAEQAAAFYPQAYYPTAKYRP